MIYASHGITDNFSPDKFCHKFLLDRKSFESYIKCKQEKYVTIEKALAGKGEAFTIDDATVASYDAAKLLRNYGHEVTWFINPFYIENRIDYWFLKLNVLLDISSHKKVILKNKEYLLSTKQEKLHFRNEFKIAIAGLPTEEERQKILAKIFDINLEDIVLPNYLKTVTKSDILELHQLGVNIQNHGWTHRQLKNADEIDIQKEILLGKEWFSKNFQYETNFYAVPFGSCFPSDSLQNIAYWLLLEGSIAPGPHNSKVFNRIGFTLT